MIRGTVPPTLKLNNVPIRDDNGRWHPVAYALLFNNWLSCGLPDTISLNTTRYNAPMYVLLGNAILQPLAAWVENKKSQDLLSVPDKLIREQWFRLALLCGIGGAAALVMMMSCRQYSLSADGVLRPGVLRLLEFYAVIQSNNLFNIFGAIDGLHFHFLAYQWNVGKIVVCVVQLLLVHMFELTDMTSQKHLLWLCLTVLWFFFAVHRESKEDEQIQAMLSFSVVGCLISVYQVSYSRRRHVLSMIAMFLYAIVFILYLTIESIAPPSADAFYYHRKWCGLSDYKADSCSRLSD